MHFRRLFRKFVLFWNVVAPLSVIVFLTQGHFLWALFTIISAHALVLIPTLIPTCGWLGEVVTHLDDIDSSSHDAKTVWLTIDDGPDPEDTPVLLDLLDEYPAKATFFFIGAKAEKYPELVREVIRRGHAVGNHTMNHPQASFWAYPPAGVRTEIDTCQSVLTELCSGKAPIWFRAPAGLKNIFVQEHLDKVGLRLACWNARGLDGVEKDPVKILSRLKSQIKPGGIILMHEGRTDLSGKRLAPQVLQEILRFLQEKSLSTSLPKVSSKA